MSPLRSTITQFKNCTRCDRIRKVDKFRKRCTGYLHSWCIDCKREYDREQGADINRARRAEALQATAAVREANAAARRAVAAARAAARAATHRPRHRAPAGTVALTLLLLLTTQPARAAPPPDGSQELEELSPWSQWFTQQSTDIGNCCALADGRTVEWRVRDNHYEVRFIHPDAFAGDRGPKAGTFYPVADAAVLHTSNPTGYAIAWFSFNELFNKGQSLGHIRCFAPPDET